MDLTPTEMTDTNEAAEQQPEVANTHDHEHDHEHEHTHQHAPSLNPELTREIEVEVGADEVSKSFKTVVKRYQKLARIPGFRAGKVPESLIRSKFAKEVRQEVLESLVSERFRKAINEQKLRPVSEPQLLDMQLVDGQPLKFKAAFEVAPEIDITGYDSVRLSKPDAALTGEEFDAELNRMLDSHATVEPVEEDRALVDGDWAEIQFRGEVKDLAQTVTEDGVQNASAQAPITGEDVLIEIGGGKRLAAFYSSVGGGKGGERRRVVTVYLPLGSGS